MSSDRVTVVIPAELEPGFLLAGADTVVAGTTSEAVDHLARLLDAEASGVIAVYQPFLAELPADQLAAYEASVSPVVVLLPSGLEEHDDVSHRTRISAMLSRAVGYHITFGEEVVR